MPKLLSVWTLGTAPGDQYAVALAGRLAQNQRVVLADFNLYTPSLAVSTGLLPGPHPHDLCWSRLLPDLKAGRCSDSDVAPLLRQVAPWRFHLLPGFWYAPALSAITLDAIRTLLDHLTSHCDVLIATCGVPVDCVATHHLLRVSDRVLLPVADLADTVHAARMVAFLESLGLPRERFVAVSASTSLPLPPPCPVHTVPAPPVGMHPRDLHADTAWQSALDSLIAALAGDESFPSAPPAPRHRFWPWGRTP